MTEQGSERRTFVRIKVQIPVRYKFLTQSGEKYSDRMFEGTTYDLSASGMLLLGEIPDTKAVIDMLSQRVVIGMNMLLPGDPEAIKAIGRVAWVEDLDESLRQCSMGVYFREITKDSKDRIFRYIIKVQIP
jgi:c-di-GMP-binding flagellar brake protein YcgR